MNCLKSIKQLLASTVVVAFFTTNVLTPIPGAYAQSVGSLSSGFQGIESSGLSTEFKIPTEFGKISEIIPAASKGSAIFHIQEAHANYDAQKNIRNILDHLFQNYGVKLILLEGAGSKLQPELFDFFPKNRELQRAVSDKLMQAGELTGAEVFLLEGHGERGSNKAEGYGIENAKAYGANLEAYRKVYQGRKLADRFLEAFYLRWQKQAALLLNKDLREFLSRETNFEEERFPLQDWMKFLKNTASRELKLNLDDVREQKDWPTLVRYFRLKAIDPKINASKAEEEKNAFLRDVAKYGEKTETRNSVRHTPSALPANEKNLGEEISAIFEAAKQHNLPPYKTRFVFEKLMDFMPKDFSFDAYPNLRLYLQQLILLSELQSDRLREEIERLTAKLTASLVKTEKDRELLAALRDYRLLTKLFQLELSRAEYQKIISNKITIEKLLHGLQTADHRLQLKAERQSAVSRLRSLYGTAIQFYEGAIERENWMMQKTLEWMKERGETKAVLITGGFHTDGLKEKILGSGSSYIEIAPRISEITKEERRNYLKALLGNSSNSTGNGERGAVNAGVQRDPSAVFWTGSADQIAAFVRSNLEFLKEVTPNWRRELAGSLARIRGIVRQVIHPGQDAEFAAGFQKLIASAVAPAQFQPVLATARAESRKSEEKAAPGEKPKRANELWPGHEIQLAGVFAAVVAVNHRFYEHLARRNMDTDLADQKSKPRAEVRSGSSDEKKPTEGGPSESREALAQGLRERLLAMKADPLLVEAAISKYREGKFQLSWELEVVNNEGHVIGTMDRRLIHETGLLHYATNAFVLTPDGKVLLQRRVHNKPEAKKLSICGGHPEIGQTLGAGVKARLMEELELDSLQGRLIAIDREDYQDPSGKNREKRVLFVYILTDLEYSKLKEASAKFETEKARKSRKEFEASIEAKQKAREGKGGAYGRVVVEFSDLLRAQKNENGRYLTLKEPFTDSISSEEVNFSADLLDRVLDIKSVQQALSEAIAGIKKSRVRSEVRETDSPITLKFSEKGAQDVLLTGGKGASLSELSSIPGVKVPKGFTITTAAFQNFMEESGIQVDLQALDSLSDQWLALKLAGRDAADRDATQKREEIEKQAQLIREKILKATIPDPIEKAIDRSYFELSRDEKILNVPVAVRSSATAEDMAEASFAGQQDTFLNQVGKATVLESVKKCWASLYGNRAIDYRDQKLLEILSKQQGVSDAATKSLLAQFKHSQVKLAAVVQRMVAAFAAGVGFNIDTATGQPGVRVEANYGFGESVVSGRVSPDSWLLDEKGEKIIDQRVGSKENRVVPTESGTASVETNESMRNRLCLSDERTVEIAMMVARIGEYYRKVKGWAFTDTEFAVGEHGDIFFLQARPETVYSRLGAHIQVNGVLLDSVKGVLPIYAGGQTAFSGASTGILRVVDSLEDAVRRVQQGDILVAPKTHPEWDPIMTRLSGVVVDMGGQTSHTAIVSRERGLPSVVQGRDATEQLKDYDGQEVTLDATNGLIYKGKHPITQGSLKDFLRTDIKTSSSQGKDHVIHRIDTEGEWIGKPEYPLGGWQYDLYKKAWEMLEQRFGVVLHKKFEKNTIYIQLKDIQALEQKMREMSLDELEAFFRERTAALDEFVKLADHFTVTETNLRKLTEIYPKLIMHFHVRWSFGARVMEPLQKEQLNSSGLPEEFYPTVLAHFNPPTDTETKEMGLHFRQLFDLARPHEKYFSGKEPQKIEEALRVEQPVLYGAIVRQSQNYKYDKDDIRLPIPTLKVIDALRQAFVNEHNGRPWVEEAHKHPAAVNDRMLAKLVPDFTVFQRIMKLAYQQAIQKENEHHIQVRKQWAIREKLLKFGSELALKNRIHTASDILEMNLDQILRLSEEAKASPDVAQKKDGEIVWGSDRAMSSSDYEDAFFGIQALHERQLDTGLRVPGKGWVNYYRITEDGDTVDYAVWVRGEPKPLLFHASVPPEVLAKADLIAVQNVGRARRPARAGLGEVRKSDDDPKQWVITPDNIRSKFPDELWMEWKGPSGKPWWEMLNQFPIWPPVLGKGIDEQPFHTTVARGDGKVFQADMKDAANILDMLALLVQQNASPGISGQQKFRLAINGWYYSQDPKAIKAGASQAQAHAQLLRFEFPIERAQDKKEFSQGDVLVSTLNDGWGTGIVVSGPVKDLQTLAEVSAKAISKITAKGHSFNLFAAPVDGDGIRIYIADRVVGTPDPYFTNEWAFSEFARTLVIDAPNLFYVMSPESQSEFENLAAGQQEAWTKARRKTGGLNEINQNLRENAIAALKLVTAPQAEIDAIIDALRADAARIPGPRAEVRVRKLSGEAIRSELVDIQKNTELPGKIRNTAKRFLSQSLISGSAQARALKWIRQTETGRSEVRDVEENALHRPPKAEEDINDFLSGLKPGEWFSWPDFLEQFPGLGYIDVQPLFVQHKVAEGMRANEFALVKQRSEARGTVYINPWKTLSDDDPLKQAALLLTKDLFFQALRPVLTIESTQVNDKPVKHPSGIMLKLTREGPKILRLTAKTADGNFVVGFAITADPFSAKVSFFVAPAADPGQTRDLIVRMGDEAKELPELAQQVLAEAKQSRPDIFDPEQVKIYLKEEIGKAEQWLSRREADKEDALNYIAPLISRESLEKPVSDAEWELLRADNLEAREHARQAGIKNDEALRAKIQTLTEQLQALTRSEVRENQPEDHGLQSAAKGLELIKKTGALSGVVFSAILQTNAAVYGTDWNEGRVFAINSVTGELDTSKFQNGVLTGSFGLSALAEGDDGTLYVGNWSESSIRAINPLTGELDKRKFNETGIFQPNNRNILYRLSSLAFANGTLYAAGQHSGTILAIKPDTGQLSQIISIPLRYMAPTGMQAGTHLAMKIIGNTLYVAGHFADQHLLAIDLKTGELDSTKLRQGTLRLEAPGLTEENLALEEIQGMLYLASGQSNWIFAVDPRMGHQKGVWQLGKGFFGISPVLGKWGSHLLVEGANTRGLLTADFLSGISAALLASGTSPKELPPRRAEIRSYRPLLMAGLVAIASFWMTAVAKAQTVFPGKPHLETYHAPDGAGGYVTQYNSMQFRFDHSIQTKYRWVSAVINFLAGGSAQNLSGYTQFEFLARGYNSGTTGNQAVFNIEFKDTDGDVATESRVHGIYSGDFQAVTVNRAALQAMYPNVNWDRIKEIAFVVDSNYGMPEYFNGWLEIKTGGLYFPLPPIAPDPNLFPYDTTPLSAAGPVWPTVVNPPGATAIATPTELGASFFLRTYGGSDNWAGGGFTFDNPATPQIETGDTRGFVNQIYTLYGGHSGVKMEVVDAANNKESVQLISIDASKKTWAIPKDSFASVNLGQTLVIYFIVEGSFKTGTLNINVVPEPLVMSGTAYSNGTAQVSFPSYAGADYRIEYTDDLASGIWTPVETITATGTQTTWIDDGSKTGGLSSTRSYRVFYVRAEVREELTEGDKVFEADGKKQRLDFKKLQPSIALAIPRAKFFGIFRTSRSYFSFKKHDLQPAVYPYDIFFHKEDGSAVKLDPKDFQQTGKAWLGDIRIEITGENLNILSKSDGIFVAQTVEGTIPPVTDPLPSIPAVPGPKDPSSGSKLRLKPITPPAKRVIHLPRGGIPPKPASGRSEVRQSLQEKLEAELKTQKDLPRAIEIWQKIIERYAVQRAFEVLEDAKRRNHEEDYLNASDRLYAAVEDLLNKQRKILSITLFDFNMGEMPVSVIATLIAGLGAFFVENTLLQGLLGVTAAGMAFWAYQAMSRWFSGKPQKGVFPVKAELDGGIVRILDTLQRLTIDEYMDLDAFLDHFHEENGTAEPPEETDFDGISDWVRAQTYIPQQPVEAVHQEPVTVTPAPVTLAPDGRPAEIQPVRPGEIQPLRSDRSEIRTAAFDHPNTWRLTAAEYFPELVENLKELTGGMRTFEKKPSLRPRIAGVGITALEDDRIVFDAGFGGTYRSAVLRAYPDRLELTAETGAVSGSDQHEVLQIDFLPDRIQFRTPRMAEGQALEFLAADVLQGIRLNHTQVQLLIPQAILPALTAFMREHGLFNAAVGFIPLIREGSETVRSGRSEMRGAGRKDDSWWRDPERLNISISLPIYALRRSQNDPGIGKFTDLGRYYQEVLAKQGVNTVLLLPHFATVEESPYAPVSLYALNELYLDWIEVPEVSNSPELSNLVLAPEGKRQEVDYPGLRTREREVAIKAFDLFEKNEIKRNTERAGAYQDFVNRFGRMWLDDYAEFMAIHEILGKASLEWSIEEVSRARSLAQYPVLVNIHRYAQWLAYEQLSASLALVHASGGKVLFDIPMFRGKDSVDVWKHEGVYFKDARTRNPGVINQYVREDWKDLALWNWKRLDQEGYGFILDPYRYWFSFGSGLEIDAGFDGARIDAFHFAYAFGNGQLASGDEPGTPYMSLLINLFKQYGAFPLAEAFEGKEVEAQQLGFVAVKGTGNWQPVTTHDDLRKPSGVDFLEGLNWHLRKRQFSKASAKFIALTLGDLWGDPEPVKKTNAQGFSEWRYRIPLPVDPDYDRRAPISLHPYLNLQLGLLGKGKVSESVWDHMPEILATILSTARSFVRRQNPQDSPKIWAASRDWFLEQWGRDTFIALPGLLLTTGRFEEAKEIIRQFAKLQKRGVIPNKIPEQGIQGAEYNTVDASLWFIQALKQYAAYTGDWDFVSEMKATVQEVLDNYRQGTGYNRNGRYHEIKMDRDGLIASPAQGTWMDADPEGKGNPVTPRNGKAVEINALWYSGLKFAAQVAHQLGDKKKSSEYVQLAYKVKRSFNEKFWNNNFEAHPEQTPLLDVIEGDPHGSALRPNMLIAVSAGEDLLSPSRQKAVLDSAASALLTPYGLRTLSPKDSLYHPEYHTEQEPWQKDQAYHQGTAWPWLLGSYIDSLVKIRIRDGKNLGEIQDEIRGLLTPLVKYMMFESPTGSIHEVFDGGVPGSSSVQKPGGTSSQAWSVAEILRVLSEYQLIPSLPGKRNRLQEAIVEEQQAQKKAEVPEPSGAAKEKVELRHYTVVSRQLEAGLDRGILEALRKKLSRRFPDLPQMIRKYVGLVAETVLTGGLGALMHDLFPAWAKNFGFQKKTQRDLIAINVIYDNIKGQKYAKNLPEEIKRGETNFGDYLRSVLDKDDSLKLSFELNVGDDFRRKAGEAQDYAWKTKQIIGKKIKVDVYSTETYFGQVPNYYLDAYFLDEDGARVSVFDEVYPDAPHGRPNLWRDVHMAVYGKASQLLLKKLQKKGIVKEKVLFVDNEVFVSTPTPMFPDAIHHHINHTVFRPGLYMPDEASYEMLEYPEVLRKKIVTPNGKINIIDAVGISSHLITGVALYEHTPVLAGDIMAAHVHKLEAYNQEGVRNTNGVLLEQWQSHFLRSLINQYKEKLKLSSEMPDKEFFKTLRLSENSALAASFQEKAEFIKAFHVAELLFWLKTEQGHPRWFDAFIKSYRHEFKKEEIDERELLEKFRRRLEGVLKDERIWEKFRTSPEAVFLKDQLLKDPIVSNARRQVSYKGPDKWLEILQELERDPKALEYYKAHAPRTILGGREFGEEAHQMFLEIQRLIKELGLQDRFETIEDYNNYIAPIIFNGVAACVMLSDEFLEASATSMMKGMTNMAALIGVWGGADPELFTIVEVKSGREVDVFGENVSHNELVARLRAGEWKITNGFLIAYDPKELSVQQGGGRRPSARSLLQALVDLNHQYQDPLTRRNLQLNVLESSWKVDMARGQAFAHKQLWEQTIRLIQDEDETFSRLKVSADDAAAFLKQILSNGSQPEFVWFKDENTVLEANRIPGALGFVEGFRNLRMRGKDAYLSIAYHSQLSPQKPAGDIFDKMEKLFDGFDATLSPVIGKIRELAERAQQAKDVQERVRLNLEALEIFERLAVQISVELFRHYVAAHDTDLEAYFAHPIVRENLARYFEENAVSFGSIAKKIEGYAVELDGKKYIVAINLGEFSYVGASGEKAWTSFYGSPGLEEVLGPAAAKENARIYQIVNAISGEEYDDYPLWQITENFPVGVPHPGVQVLQLKDTGRKTEERASKLRADVVHLLEALAQGRLVSDGKPITQSLFQQINTVIEKPEDLRELLRGVADLSRAEAVKKFGVQGIPPVMAFVTALSPELLDLMKEWNEEVHAKLIGVVNSPENEELFRAGEIWFHHVDKDSVMVISRAFSGEDTPHVIVPIHFGEPQHYDASGKIWFRILDVVHLGIQNSEGMKYQVYDQLLNEGYDALSGASIFREKWAIGIPVVDPKDPEKIMERFQILKMMPTRKGRSEIRDAGAEAARGVPVPTLKRLHEMAAEAAGSESDIVKIQIPGLPGRAPSFAVVIPKQWIEKYKTAVVLEIQGLIAASKSTASPEQGFLYAQLFPRLATNPSLMPQQESLIAWMKYLGFADFKQVAGQPVRIRVYNEILNKALIKQEPLASPASSVIKSASPVARPGSSSSLMVPAPTKPAVPETAPTTVPPFEIKGISTALLIDRVAGRRAVRVLLERMIPGIKITEVRVETGEEAKDFIDPNRSYDLVWGVLEGVDGMKGEELASLVKTQTPGTSVILWSQMLNIPRNRELAKKLVNEKLAAGVLPKSLPQPTAEEISQITEILKRISRSETRDIEETPEVAVPLAAEDIYWDTDAFKRLKREEPAAAGRVQDLFPSNIHHLVAAFLLNEVSEAFAVEAVSRSGNTDLRGRRNAVMALAGLLNGLEPDAAARAETRVQTDQNTAILKILGEFRGGDFSNQKKLAGFLAKKGQYEKTDINGAIDRLYRQALTDDIRALGENTAFIIQILLGVFPYLEKLGPATANAITASALVLSEAAQKGAGTVLWALNRQENGPFFTQSKQSLTKIRDIFGDADIPALKKQIPQAVQALDRLSAIQRIVQGRLRSEIREIAVGQTDTRDETSVTFTTIEQIFSENQRLGGGREGFIEVPERITGGVYSMAVNDWNVFSLVEPLIPSAFAAEAVDIKQSYRAARAVVGLTNIQDGFILGPDLALKKGMLAMAKTVFEGSFFVILIGKQSDDRQKAEALIKQYGLEAYVSLQENARNAESWLRSKKRNASLAGMISPEDSVSLAQELKETLKNDPIVMGERMRERFLKAAPMLQALMAQIAAQFSIVRSA